VAPAASLPSPRPTVALWRLDNVVIVAELAGCGLVALVFTTDFTTALAFGALKRPWLVFPAPGMRRDYQVDHGLHGRAPKAAQTPLPESFDLGSQLIPFRRAAVRLVGPRELAADPGQLVPERRDRGLQCGRGCV